MASSRTRQGNKWLEAQIIEQNKIPEQKLWTAVLTIAADDAVQNKVGRVDVYNDIDRARNWFKEPTQNFFQVCLYAGYEPMYVHRKMKRAIEKQEKKEENEREEYLS